MMRTQMRTPMTKPVSRSLRHLMVAYAALAIMGAGAVSARAQGSAPDLAAIVAAPDRSDADRDTDKKRDPIKLFGFTGVRTGMTVLDMGAGGGYSTEMLARAVGPSGKVYGQNAPDLAGRAKERFDARMKTPAMANVTSLGRPFDDPLPADAAPLDLITFFFFYHDVSYSSTDRAAMNRKLFAALKPGASLVIADHSAKAGEGISVARTLHRIEEAALRREIEAAGFKLAAEGDFFRQPGDARDFNVNRPTGPVDEFVLRFEKQR
jgi:predicted methyltransferase